MSSIPLSGIPPFFLPYSGLSIKHHFVVKLTSYYISVASTQRLSKLLNTRLQQQQQQICAKSLSDQTSAGWLNQRTDCRTCRKGLPTNFIDFGLLVFN